MTEAAPVVDQAGVTRSGDGTGTIADQSPTALAQEPSPTTSPEPSTTSEPKADGKTLLTEGKPEDPKPAEGAPDKYEDYKVPEGYTLDPDVKGEADKIFKGLGLNQSQAQSLVDFYTAKTTESHNQPYEAYQEMTQAWRTESESHPDLKGKLGPGQEVNVRISRALDGLGDPKLASDFKALMDLTGAGNHQAFIRVIDKLAAKVTEGTHVAGRGPSPLGQSEPNRPQPSAAAALWPTLPSSRG